MADERLELYESYCTAVVSGLSVLRGSLCTVLVGSPATRGSVRMPCLGSFSVLIKRSQTDGAIFPCGSDCQWAISPFYFFFCFVKWRLRNREFVISTVGAAIALSCRLRFPHIAVTFVSQLRYEFSYSTKKKLLLPRPLTFRSFTYRHVCLSLHEWAFSLYECVHCRYFYVFPRLHL